MEHQDRRNSGRGWWWSLASDIADYTIQPHTGKHNHKEFEETIDMFGDRLECQGLQIHNKKYQESDGKEIMSLPMLKYISQQSVWLVLRQRAGSGKVKELHRKQ